ncbi:hypothetical protein [Streptomyces sp. WAC06614]|uniref:hypothetical protein n=1 Tax=Streptomyces sp. WAC06614 TaxID=2487416 RepID=UPI001C8EBEBA|nr:hypothetical protein [Streptomyces sp. WAC06614]
MAMPSGDTRVDPEARPERQRVRSAVAGLGGDTIGRGLPARWDLLERTAWPAAAPPAPEVSLYEVAATVFAPVRFEVDNPYPEHRAYPSPRAKFPVRTVVQEGGAARFPRPEAGDALGVPVTAAAPGGDHVRTFALPEALPPFYGPLRAVLTGLETGHVLGSLALLGRAMGRPLTVAGRSGVTETWAGPLPGEAVPGYVMTPERDVDLDGAREAGTEGGAPAPVGRAPWNQVVWARNSGRAPRGVSGFTAAHRPAPAALWETALRTLADSDRGLGSLRAARSRIGLFCWVRGVEGVRDGCYAVGFDGTARRVGDLAAARGALLVDSATAPGLAFELDACNLVWLFTADTGAGPADAAPARETGRAEAATVEAATAEAATVEAATVEAATVEAVAADLLAAAGWTAQHLSYAMAAHGLFARPLRSYDAEGAAAALGLGADLVPIYQLACGPNRFTEPALDVRRPSGGSA